MTDRHERGLLDTSILVDLETIPEAMLPSQAAISSVTLAELAAGVHTTNDPRERGARLARLQALEANFDCFSFDSETARCCGRLVSLAIAAGQQHRPRRLDLMIAATASVHGLPLYTRNAKDFRALSEALTVVAV
jgi:predicted nucleic acid-binding protein